MCVCVCVLLVSPKLLKTKRWYVERHKVNNISISDWPKCEKIAVFVLCMICSPRRLVASNPDSCKSYPVYNRLTSTLLFHVYHECDGDTQEILIALLSKLAYYTMHAI